MFSFADRLNKLFEQKLSNDGDQFSCREVARATGVSANLVSLLRRGAPGGTNPSVAVVRALAEFFGVQPSYFLDEESPADELYRQHLRQPTVRRITSLSAGLCPTSQKAILGFVEYMASQQERGKVVLIVEDDKDASLLFASQLEEAGFETVAATDGEEAWQLLPDVRPDLVVLDLHLPKINGMEILRRIRRDCQLAETAVIVATCDERLAASVHDEANAVLVKPILNAQLRTAAQRVMDLPVQ